MTRALINDRHGRCEEPSEEGVLLLALAERVDASSQSDNSLDVLVEVALFAPAGDAVSCRANAAGTKVIYTMADGKSVTHWAPDWTSHPLAKLDAAAALRARAQSGAAS